MFCAVSQCIFDIWRFTDTRIQFLEMFPCFNFVRHYFIFLLQKKLVLLPLIATFRKIFLEIMHSTKRYRSTAICNTLEMFSSGIILNSPFVLTDKHIDNYMKLLLFVRVHLLESQCSHFQWIDLTMPVLIFHLCLYCCRNCNWIFGNKLSVTFNMSKYIASLFYLWFCLK